MPPPGFVALPGTAHFTFAFEQQLDAASATALGAALAATAERDFSTMSFWFAGIIPSGVPFKVLISLGTSGGASNDNVSNIDLLTGQSTDVDQSRSNLVAEVVEIFMAASGLPWKPGDSIGEGLSQVAACTLYPDETGLLNGPGRWLDTSIPAVPPVASRPDFIKKAKPTDNDFVSFGCSQLFIYYLRSQLGFSMKAIVQAAADSLEGVYTKLTKDKNAFPQFSAVLEKRFPSGKPSNLSGGSNPFPLPSGATLSAKRFLASHSIPPGLLGRQLRDHRDQGDMRALLNSDRPSALV